MGSRSRTRAGRRSPGRPKGSRVARLAQRLLGLPDKPVPKFLAWFSGMVALAVAAITLLLPGLGQEEPAAVPGVPEESRGRIESPSVEDPPQKNSPIPVVRGTASLSNGEQLWLLSRPPSGHYFTTTSNPQPLVVDDRGEWRVTNVGIGKDDQDSGKKFQLCLVREPKSASAIMNALARRPRDRTSAEFPTLPPQVTQLHCVVVTRA